MIQLDEKKQRSSRQQISCLTRNTENMVRQPRRVFNEKTIAQYYGEILRDRRRELKLTQKQLAQKISKKQSYIALHKKEKQIFNYLVSSVSLVR